MIFKEEKMMVQEIKIGKSTVQTTKLGLGTNKVGGHNLFQNLNDQDGYDVVRKALDSGIKLLDTAYIYGEGRSEEIIGEVIQNYDRSKIVIATKAAQDPQNNNQINNEPAFLKQAVKDALKRLQTAYIDIFYIHFPDNKTPKNEAVAALNELKQAGLIRAVGVSNFTPEQIKEANIDGLVDIVEDHYNLVHRQIEKTEWPYLKQNKIAFVPYFPLASGLLTGRYTLNDYEKFADDYSKVEFETIINALAITQKIADRHSATVTQTILAWYITNPNIAVVIPGARNQQQAAGNVEALNVTLSEAEFQQIDKAFADFKNK
ncbi:NADP-dependent oxidoreductase domain-containing protein [Loigolactobacillus bifermentans DSM 20003]|uniref:NADP-dependent oxidoreductase domain-containing protein n=2 Tax=Loigolactobacillus bifermentans TaxID=1607 RepID=A0A0R1H7E4_9LACO|nr:NADP-dependent oxidoreductase domain-containing protein [Loigolactobacillus bifermentans DSM 20003]